MHRVKHPLSKKGAKDFIVAKTFVECKFYPREYKWPPSRGVFEEIKNKTVKA